MTVNEFAQDCSTHFFQKPTRTHRIKFMELITKKADTYTLEELLKKWNQNQVHDCHGIAEEGLIVEPESGA